jgi:hypothetical protein
LIWLDATFVGILCAVALGLQGDGEVNSVYPVSAERRRFVGWDSVGSHDARYRFE